MKMDILPGTKFSLVPSMALIKTLHTEGWAGSTRGSITEADADRVAVRFADGQPWGFRREAFLLAAQDDQPEDE